MTNWQLKTFKIDGNWCSYQIFYTMMCVCIKPECTVYSIHKHIVCMLKKYIEVMIAHGQAVVYIKNICRSVDKLSLFILYV